MILTEFFGVGFQELRVTGALSNNNSEAAVGIGIGSRRTVGGSVVVGMPDDPVEQGSADAAKHLLSFTLRPAGAKIRGKASHNAWRRSGGTRT